MRWRRAWTTRSLSSFARPVTAAVPAKAARRVGARPVRATERPPAAGRDEPPRLEFATAAPPPSRASPAEAADSAGSPASADSRERTTPLERVVIGLVSLALAALLIALMSGFFAGRDQAGLSRSAGGAALGQSFPDLGDAHLRPGQLRPPYASDPPTSGAHVPVPVTRDARPLSNDQLLEALARGNIVILYGTRRPPPGLAALARSVAGAFTPALAAAGQAVIIARREGTEGLVGLAWTRMVRVSAADDPLLRAFAEQWLGRGARD
jgi:hypothetical protein